jgi:hypothetical protein
LFVAPNVELHIVALEFAFDHLGHLHSLAFQLHISVARDRMIIDGEQNVTRLKNFCAWSGRDDCLDQHAATVVLQSKKFPLGRVLQFPVSNSKIDIPIVATLADVLEETINHRRRHHVSDALRDVTAVTLKRDADHLRVLHHGTATVARINLGADLNGEVLINR